jgi:hypothetical protein
MVAQGLTRGTATAGPNFAWVLATRALQRLGADERLDLSRLRIALNGAEPVDATAVEAFIEAAVPHGLRPGAVFPAFGMAEVVIGATFPEPMAGLRVDHVDARMLEEHKRAEPAGDGADARRLVRLGRPLPGLEIRIVDEATGEVLGQRAVGELEIRGTSVTPGYYRRDDTAGELFRDGWLRTGDLAYTVDGELVVCGRSKDVIIVGGRNIFPDDIERAVGDVDGVGRAMSSPSASTAAWQGVDRGRGEVRTRRDLLHVAPSEARSAPCRRRCLPRTSCCGASASQDVIGQAPTRHAALYRSPANLAHAAFPGRWARFDLRASARLRPGGGSALRVALVDADLPSMRPPERARSHRRPCRGAPMIAGRDHLTIDRVTHLRHSPLSRGG